MTDKEKKSITEEPLADGKVASEESGDNSKEKSSAKDEDETVKEESEKESTPEEKIEELNDKFLRLYSEFDNYKRRTTKERLELFKTAGEDIIVSLLPILDDFDRAMKAAEDSKEVKEVRQGMELIKNKFITTLEQKGLEPMDSMGKVFDTDNHEAITKIPAPKKKLKGKVVDVIEKGFFLNGKVIRHAKVVVGS